MGCWAVFGTLCSHFAQIVLFAVAYYLLRDDLDLGGLAGQLRDVFASYLSFSTETHTSLGFGDIYPLGQTRLVAGVEALTGLLMIRWSVSFTYLEMALLEGGLRHTCTTGTICVISTAPSRISHCTSQS